MRACLMLAAAAALAALPQALAHGYMMQPAARNWLVAGQRQKNSHSAQNFYTPMSLNRPGRPVNGATCGGLYTGDGTFDVGGRFANRRITASYKAGRTISVTIRITNNHWGYFGLRLCPLKGTSDSAERSRLSESCFQRYILKQANGSGPKYWLYRGAPGSQYTVTSSWKLPQGIRCPRCVLQWRYVSGHMCYLPGVDKKRMLRLQPGGNKPCPSNYASLNAVPAEKFWNCADIRIT